MSSVVRRLQIRRMKRAGFMRNKWIIGRNLVTGAREPIAVRRGGEITDRDDNPIGRQWPHCTRRAADQPRARRKGPARGTRRGKPSKVWAAARAARKAAA